MTFPRGQSARLTLLTIATLLVALGLLYLKAVDSMRSAERRVGVTLDPIAEGVLVTELSPDGAAARGGTRAGDFIVEVEGIPVRGLQDYDLAAGDFRRGRPSEFKVRRGGEVVSLTVSPGGVVDWLAYLISAVAALMHLALALVVLPYARDVRARLVFFFALLVALEFALPNFNIGFPFLVVAGTAFFYLLTGVQMAVELHLASVIPEPRTWMKSNRRLVPALYLVGVGLGALAAVTYLVESIAAESPFPWSSEQVVFILMNVGLPVWALALVALLGVPSLRWPEARGRHQATFVLIGVTPWILYILLGAILGLFGSQLPPAVDTWFPLLVLCYPVAVFVAIFRYHLFDIELVVRRGLVYASLTTSLLLVFYAILGAGGALVSRLAGRELPSLWVTSAATLVLGLLFNPLRGLIQKTIDRKFFPERFAAREEITQLVSSLPTVGPAPEMGRFLVAEVCRVFGAKSASVLFAEARAGLLTTHASTLKNVETDTDITLMLMPQDPGLAWLREQGKPRSAAAVARRSQVLGQRLQLYQAEIVVPMATSSGLAGALLVGGRKGGEKYRAEELELLNLLGHTVATVFDNARLFASATFDSLTGLRRRESIIEELIREAQRAIRYDRPLTVGMADIDSFKPVNDNHGHLVGDAYLKKLAGALQSALRGTDSIGRYGGEEFLLVLPETDSEGGVTLAEKVRSVVEETSLVLQDGAEIRLTISIGLASLSERAGEPSKIVQRLVEEADRALYEAKRLGRNRVKVGGGAR